MREGEAAHKWKEGKEGRGRRGRKNRPAIRRVHEEGGNERGVSNRKGEGAREEGGVPGGRKRRKARGTEAEVRRGREERGPQEVLVGPVPRFPLVVVLFFLFFRLGEIVKWLTMDV